MLCVLANTVPRGGAQCGVFLVMAAAMHEHCSLRRIIHFFPLLYFANKFSAAVLNLRFSMQLPAAALCSRVTVSAVTSCNSVHLSDSFSSYQLQLCAPE